MIYNMLVLKVIKIELTQKSIYFEAYQAKIKRRRIGFSSKGRGQCCRLVGIFFIENIDLETANAISLKYCQLAFLYGDKENGNQLIFTKKIN